MWTYVLLFLIIIYTLLCSCIFRVLLHTTCIACIFVLFQIFHQRTKNALSNNNIFFHLYKTNRYTRKNFTMKYVWTKKFHGNFS